MPPKRDKTVTFRLSDHEELTLRSLADEWGMDVSELVRACLAIGLPVIQDVDFMRRVRLEDSKAMRERQ